ncbi:MAG TPA: hypothetical protein ENG13_04930 [bacterium]|nr:hypothetical protein [bacterium]HEX68390.1 hypothetical protein [bacterium]
MVEEWKYIKDFVAVIGGEDTILDFLRGKGLRAEKRTYATIEEIKKCILQAETEDGVKSCITVNIEDLHPKFFGPGYKGEAEELYNKLKKDSVEAIKDTWGKFIL